MHLGLDISAQAQPPCSSRTCETPPHIDSLGCLQLSLKRQYRRVSRSSIGLELLRASIKPACRSQSVHCSATSPPAFEATERKPRLGIFVSGGGSNFRAIHCATVDGRINADVAVRGTLFVACSLYFWKLVQYAMCGFVSVYLVIKILLFYSAFLASNFILSCK